MTEHELELRLRSAARALDANAPVFDPAVLRTAGRRRVSRTVVALAAVAALAGLTVAPAAISALGDLFDVESVPELGSVAPNVAPAFLGRQTTLDAAQATVPFRIRTIPSLGTPDQIYARDDIEGGTVMVAYDGMLLTQWPATDVHPRITVVPDSGTAENVTVGQRPALWVAGAARGTITVIGADGTVHHELFDVAAGALLWQSDTITFLLQGTGTKEQALRLAAEISP